MTDTVTITRTEYEQLLSRIEDIEDAMTAMALEARYEANGGPTDKALPVELVRRMPDGESRVRVWREQRGLTLQQLADASGQPAETISRIGTGEETGSVAILKALAAAPRVEIGDLV